MSEIKSCKDDDKHEPNQQVNGEFKVLTWIKSNQKQQEHPDNIKLVLRLLSSADVDNTCLWRNM